MAGEELPWWAYSRTPMFPQCELCSGVHETSQCGFYNNFDPYVAYEEQPYFQYHPQQYQQDVSNMPYFWDGEEFQHQQPTPTFQSDEFDALEEIRMLSKSNEESFNSNEESINSLETQIAQMMRFLEQENQQIALQATPENNDEIDALEEIRMIAKSNEASINSLETQIAQMVRFLEQENQQVALKAIPENNGNVEQGTTYTIEEEGATYTIEEGVTYTIEEEGTTYTIEEGVTYTIEEEGTTCAIEEDKFQDEASIRKPSEEFDHASEVDALERALYGTNAGELHKFHELVGVYQEAVDRGEDADLLLVSSYKDGGSALEPMEEILFEEPKASVTYTYPPPLYSQEARECVLFYKLTDFGSTEDGIGKRHNCYTNRPSENKGQKVCRRDDDEVSRRDDQANYYHP